MNNQSNPSRARKITFKVLNIILIVGMLAGGLSQVFGAEQQTQFFIKYGYPLYLMTIVGIGKIIGGIVLILPRMPLLKVSAYTGSVIVTTCAFISHLLHGDVVFAIAPFIVTFIAIMACLLNPDVSFARPQVAKFGQPQVAKAES